LLQDICSFKVAILFFTRAISEQKGYIENALGDNESGGERSCKSTPELNSPLVKGSFSTGPVAFLMPITHLREIGVENPNQQTVL